MSVVTPPTPGIAKAQRAVFLDRDGTINEDHGYIKKPDDFIMLPGVAAAVRRLNDADYRTIVVTNQPIIARGECSVEGLRLIHDKMEMLLGREKAHLDRIYYCPHYPEKRFPAGISELQITCDCRKPQAGLLRQAQCDLNIDFSQSWIVGDSTVDIKAGAEVGVRSILVQTGHAGRDGKCIATPGFIMPDLAAAVDFILKGTAQKSV